MHKFPKGRSVETCIDDCFTLNEMLSAAIDDLGEQLKSLREEIDDIRQDRTVQ